MSHPSVGTQEQIVKREAEKQKLQSLQLTTSQLEIYVLSVEEMRMWGYITEIPDGDGGSKPSEEGAVQKCERCSQPFQVKRKEEAEECVHHWGRKFTSKRDGSFSRLSSSAMNSQMILQGEKSRLWTCCSRAYGEEGCTRGPHVFYESDPVDLHRRHAFSHTRAASSSSEPSSSKDTALDIVALDCEMIYTTGGMRVARVSAVDSVGREVYDELVRMDEGVEVMWVCLEPCPYVRMLTLMSAATSTPDSRA